MINVQELPYPIFTKELELLSVKKIHIICQAIATAGSNLHTYVQHVQQTTLDLPNLVNQVNTPQESGTMYPFYYLSAYPNASIENLELPLIDLIINANDKYLRSDTILLVIEKSMDFAKTKALVEELVDKNRAKIKFARTIYIVQH